MIVVTGGAGFIGRNLVEDLAKESDNIVVIDNHVPRYFRRGKNFTWMEGCKITYVSTEDSYLWLGFNCNNIEKIFHLGARTDTAEKDVEIFKKLNLNYSKLIWNFCTDNKIPLVYASSAATYGDGGNHFDDERPFGRLHPLNAYGQSKQDFDTYVFGSSYFSEKPYCPPRWAGFKFFNVYGYHESHKGNMASVVYHFYNQIKETGAVKLFRSHRSDFMNGEQKRDFIYVDDITSILIHSIDNIHSGIYNLGTGRARTYNELAEAIFKELDVPVNISYIDIPLEIRNGYQYFTEAKMDKLKDAVGMHDYFFTPLEEGISLYIKQLEDENR